MSDFGLRARRADNAPTVLLQGRVSPETRGIVKDAADASGVTMAFYLEALFAKLVEENGGTLPLVTAPVRVPRARRNQQAAGMVELDLSIADAHSPSPRSSEAGHMRAA